MVSNSIYRPPYPARTNTSWEDCNCNKTGAGNATCVNCWYTWGWVAAFYCNGVDSKLDLKGLKKKISDWLTTNSSWKRACEQGVEDGYHARLESQGSGITNT